MARSGKSAGGSPVVAARRRVHGAALGYQPLRMKPVHFATSFLLSLTGRRAELEWLNKTSVPKATPSRVGDPYVAENLLPLLRQEGRASDSIGIEEFRTLRVRPGIMTGGPTA